MVFAINKIDKPGANPDKIREDLANILRLPLVPVSAATEQKIVKALSDFSQ